MATDRHTIMITIGFCLTCAFICFVLGTSLDPWYVANRSVRMNLVCIVFIFRMRLESTWPFWTSKKLIGLWKVCETRSEKKTICVPQPSTCEFIVKENKKKSCRRLLNARILLIASCVLAGLTALSCLVCGLRKVKRNRFVILFCQIPLFITLAVSIIGVYFGIYFGSRKDRFYLAPKLDNGAIYFIIGVDMAVFGGLLSMFIY